MANKLADRFRRSTGNEKSQPSSAQAAVALVEDVTGESPVSGPTEPDPEDVTFIDEKPFRLSPGQKFLSFMLSLPVEVWNKYQSIPRMAERLEKCAEHNSERPLYFTDAERIELEQMLGRNFFTAGEVIDRLKSTNRPKLGGVPLELDQQMVDRIQLRAEAYGKTYEEMLMEYATYGIKVQTGLY